MITVNFAKAQEVTKDRLRVARVPLLQAQDIAYQRATETGASTSDIVAEKQRLRNITKEADKAMTLDELMGLSA